MYLALLSTQLKGVRDIFIALLYRKLQSYIKKSPQKHYFNDFLMQY